MSRQLEVAGLSFAYGARKVLHNLSFNLDERCLCALLGRNGAGKSTLFRLLLGFYSDYRGRISLQGRDLKTYSEQQLAQRVAWIPQQTGGRFSYSVLEMVLMGSNVRLSLWERPGEEEVRSARAALRRLGIENLAERTFARLSGGEQQLVLLARALNQGSRILLLDEPCANLDLGNRVQVMETLRDLAAEGYLLLYSSHSPQQILNYADRVLLLETGQIRADGDPTEVLSEERLSRLYGIQLKLLATAQGTAVLAGETRLSGKSPAEDSGL